MREPISFSGLMDVSGALNNVRISVRSSKIIKHIFFTTVCNIRSLIHLSCTASPVSYLLTEFNDDVHYIYCVSD